MLSIKRWRKPTMQLPENNLLIKRFPGREKIPWIKMVLFLGGLFFISNLISLFSLLQQIKGLREDQEAWEVPAVQTSQKNQEIPILKAEELPMVIEQCTISFQKANVQVQSFNLERFSEETRGSSSRLHFASVRMKLRGSWEGIQRGIDSVETYPNQVIDVQEAKLLPEGGEILLKIYFHEPDNPKSP